MPKNQQRRSEAEPGAGASVSRRGSIKGSKNRTLEELAKVVRGIKRQGKKVVQAHGVFDLLHVGHIRHFEQARAMGDVLVVTLTPDCFVNKGPHRPAFPQGLRAEAVAALDAVDFVAINRWPTAENAIKLLRPDIYVKGSDYKDARKDVTGGIRLEEDAVRSVGGELRTTEDITFSSSTLINRHLSTFDDPVNSYLEGLRKRCSPADICGQLEKLRGLKVLVVGETILDEYVYCDALGKSAKEPILAMQYLSKETHGGGALAIANHAAEFCPRVDLITYLGAADSHEEFVRHSLKPNVRPTFIYKSGSPTIVKRRFVEKYLLAKLFEIYEMNDSPLCGREEGQLCAALDRRLAAYDVVIAADFGHGLITPRAVDLLTTRTRFLAVNTQINAANVGFHTISKYNRADYICIHEGEVRLDHRSRQGDIKELVEDISRRLSCGRIMVTRGKGGTLLYRRGEGFSQCPAFARKVVDRIGAGDAVLTITAMCAAAGMSSDMIGFIGNLAGAQAVTIIGNSASISKVAMLKSIESILK